ncbi:MAG: DUF2293 domain-containing protein [Planctomycetota bacterium]
MKHESLIVAPGTRDREVRFADGKLADVPGDWELLPPGDAGLTRRVKAAGPSWTVKKKKGRRVISQGVWASAAVIEAKREELASERDTDSYRKRRKSDAARRVRHQQDYVTEFKQHVISFLSFHPRHEAIGRQLADAVSRHATPVGSGTVARTKRIPIEERAESAVIAWMRHQTTAYESLKIPRIRGKRREIRRLLAKESRMLLKRYRDGQNVEAKRCPLQTALSRTADQT